MPKVDIRSEPTRPGPTVTFFDGLFLRNYDRYRAEKCTTYTYFGYFGVVP